MPPLGFLRSLSRREGPLSIREAREEDYPDMESFADISGQAYSGLGGAMREAIREDVALTAWQRDRLAGFILAHRQGPNVAWIHGLGLAHDVSPDTVGGALLGELEAHLRAVGVSWIGYMDEHGLGWLRRLLERAGFHRNTRVVSYEAPVQPPPTRGNPTVSVRPATAADIPAVARLDSAAFGPLWAYREEVLHRVLGEVAYFQVAESDGTVVGYILCTVYHRDRVHVVRLAVDPQAQSQGIGARLLAEAYDHFGARGIRWISLNTQEENARSQRLYRWFGFRPTGEDMGVWAKELTGGEDDKGKR
jgi:ribosomal protein S18 acetylase RimI-like enzyme